MEIWSDIEKEGATLVVDEIDVVYCVDIELKNSIRVSHIFDNRRLVSKTSVTITWH